MIVYAFPGQGSQKKGMGAHLFSRHTSLVEKADEILGYSVKQLCLEDKDRQLSNTAITQPVLYTVNALHYHEKICVTGIEPDCLMGHSLGEFNALQAAGVFDFETGLLMVKKRAELMSKARKGKMAAIIGAPIDKVREFLRNGSFETITIANLNAPYQHVISGPEESVTEAEKVFNAEKITYIPLNVSGAFHSPLMAEAGDEFTSFIGQFKFSVPKITVMSNYTAMNYTETSLYNNLCKQITSPVRWLDSMEYLMNSGALLFEEIGPGNVLTKLTEQIVKAKLNN
ncbi:MAG: ACP S-malonyltransferase [Sediminibacterium magnilacihabitans]|jgi:malonyl CoA-acyl carrier protein transacylase|nr:ACP S-malonyltransferase [Sediminibacterium magnilacihabitans]PQV59450.1 malonyl CoA-acyl carrier protein transacylase [Sediminibacterium magnilacihabitans]